MTLGPQDRVDAAHAENAEPQAETVEEPTASAAPLAPAVDAPPVSVGPQVYCFACGAQIDSRAEICPKCGVRQPAATLAARPAKDKTTAALLAIFLGGFGIHKFYLGKTALGVIYLVFFWTFIPAIVGFIEGIIYLTKSEEAWAAEWSK